MVFAGDEFGLEGDCDDLARRTIPWEQQELWDTSTLLAYQELLNLRRNSEALVHGGLRWVHVNDDVLVWLRESAGERLLICVARNACPDVMFTAHDWKIGAHSAVFGSDLRVIDGVVTIPTSQPGTSVWRVSA